MIQKTFAACHRLWALVFPSLEGVWQDVRYAVRMLGKAPGFAATAMFALALGIGGSTAVFSLFDAIRMRAIPYAEPDRLVELWGTMQRAAVERRGTSYPDWRLTT